MIGGFNGGFLNMGTPELIVIGAVAWAVLGPKELFKLAKQAGEFIGEWQQLGMQAKDTFTSALEQELAADEMEKAAEEAAASPPPPAWGETPPASPVEPAAAASSSSIPSLADYQAQRESELGAPGASMEMTEEEEAAVRESLYDTLGEPGENAANFAEQMSGARNAAVLSQYPAELDAADAVGPQDGSPLDVQSAEELLLANQIAETQNALETLRAEKEILGLKRQQLEANAVRAKKMAEEKAMQEKEERQEAATITEEDEEGSVTIKPPL